VDAQRELGLTPRVMEPKERWFIVHRAFVAWLGTASQQQCDDDDKTMTCSVIKC